MCVYIKMCECVYHSHTHQRRIQIIKDNNCNNTIHSHGKEYNLHSVSHTYTHRFLLIVPAFEWYSFNNNIKEYHFSHRVTTSAFYVMVGLFYGMSTPVGLFYAALSFKMMVQNYTKMYLGKHFIIFNRSTYLTHR